MTREYLECCACHEEHHVLRLLAMECKRWVTETKSVPAQTVHLSVKELHLVVIDLLHHNCLSKELLSHQ